MESFILSDSENIDLYIITEFQHPNENGEFSFVAGGPIHPTRPSDLIRWATRPQQEEMIQLKVRTNFSKTENAMWVLNDVLPISIHFDEFVSGVRILCKSSSFIKKHLG